MFLNKLLRKKFFKYLRNFIGFRPAHFLLDYEKKNISVSDAFFWRTDKSFKTLFKFTDLLNLYFKDDSSEVEIFFYSKNAKLIKKMNIKNIDLTNQIQIDKFFLNGLEDYGTFFIYHKSKANVGNSIRNSCYTGYSFQDNLPSFVHGNTLTSFKSFDGQISQDLIGGKSFFTKQKYYVQNNYKLGKTEILLVNPCNKKIKVEINNSVYHLKKGCSKLIEIFNNDIIAIKSKSYLLRPIVFNYKGEYLDVHHG